VIEKLAQSDIVVVDDHAPILDWMTLDDRTRVIQLWHAGAGFKSSGYSRWGHEGCPAPYSAHRQYDFGIAGSKNIAPFFSEVWGINDEQVLPTGMPRMDEYLDEAHKKAKTEELYKEFPLCKGKKVILFAPTYRGRNKKTAHYPYELIDFDKFYELCNNEYVVLFKMHPWVAQAVPIPEKYKDRFVDVNRYPNINDLFYITDLLITDYSSNIFEYSLMGNPMLFFAFDKIQYSFSRGFHRAYEESAPGKVCYTFDELLTAIEQKDFEEEKVARYVEHHFDYIDTHASDRVIDWLILGKIPEDIQKELAAVEEANRRMNEMEFEIFDEDLVDNEEDD
jgi:CDP-ribitol ribitolphosphotransferase